MKVREIGGTKTRLYGDRNHSFAGVRAAAPKSGQLRRQENHRPKLQSLFGTSRDQETEKRRETGASLVTPKTSGCLDRLETVGGL